MRTKKIIYLAGKMTGNNNFRDQFNAAADELTRAGYVVLNPAKHPDGLTYEQYMRIDIAMIYECEALCLLPGWIESRGAKFEKHLSEILGHCIFYYDEWQREINVKRWLEEEAVK